MSAVRFNIGVPRGGSAARLAEDSAGSQLSSLRPQGGSAARAAEQRRQVEGTSQPRAVSIGLRATGGRNVLQEAAAVESISVPHTVISAIAPSISAGQVPAAAPISAVGSIEDERLSALPAPTAASRIQSLVRSLFSPGGPSSKS